MKLLHYINDEGDDVVIAVKEISSFYKKNEKLGLIIIMKGIESGYRRFFENADQLDRAYLEVYRLMEQEV